MAAEELEKADEELVIDPLLALSQRLFLLKLKSGGVEEGAMDVDGSEESHLLVPGFEKDDTDGGAGVRAALLELGMVDKYVATCAEFGWEKDEGQIADVRARNAEKEKELDEKIKDAEENLGDVEIRDALHEKAQFLRKIGADALAETAFDKAEEKTAAVGQKMDIVFALMRTNISKNNWAGVKRLLHKSKQLFEEGGDWERKNRLKVYEGLHALATRDFKRAAELFLDCVSTFTCYELFDYTQLVFYAVLSATVALGRVELKKKVIDSPEVRSVIGKTAHLQELMNDLYECKYAGFLAAMLGLSPMINSNMYLHPHFRFIIRELRVVGYTQFLESYRSVTLQSMASSFGLSTDFLDRELSSFICRGRLSCKIDKVEGIVKTIRPDAKNALYQSVIKNGDFLLNRVQKLSKVIEL